MSILHTLWARGKVVPQETVWDVRDGHIRPEHGLRLLDSICASDEAERLALRCAKDEIIKIASRRRERREEARRTASTTSLGEALRQAGVR
jgi:hypothetical protein